MEGFLCSTYIGIIRGLLARLGYLVILETVVFLVNGDLLVRPEIWYVG